jgi:hypothetical protein
MPDSPFPEAESQQNATSPCPLVLEGDPKTVASTHDLKINHTKPCSRGTGTHPAYLAQRCRPEAWLESEQSAICTADAVTAHRQ